MRRIKIDKEIQDKTFPINLKSNTSSFHSSLKKTNNSVKTKANFNSGSITTSTTTLSDKIEAKTDINNQPTDIYYDEVIFYDGGDVDGYGY